MGSVNYGGNIELELGCVGCYSLSDGCVEDSECPINARRCLAVDALEPIFEVRFGAKRSRYLPHGLMELAIAVVSDKPVPLPPGSLPLSALLEETVSKLKAYKEKLGVESKVIVLVNNALKEKIEYGKAMESLLRKFENGIKEEEPIIVNGTLEFLDQIKKSCELECGGQKCKSAWDLLGQLSNKYNVSLDPDRLKDVSDDFVKVIRPLHEVLRDLDTQFKGSFVRKSALLSLVPPEAISTDEDHLKKLLSGAWVEVEEGTIDKISEEVIPVDVDFLEHNKGYLELDDEHCFVVLAQTGEGRARVKLERIKCDEITKNPLLSMWRLARSEGEPSFC